MPRSVQVYSYLLGAAGISAFLFYAPRLPLAMLLPTVGFLLCAAVFQRLPLILPNRFRFSLGSLFVLLAYAHVGVSGAFAVELAAAAVVAYAAKGLVRKLFNVGQLLLSLLPLHLTATALGMQAGPVTWPQIGAMVVGSLSFFLANMGMVGIVMRLVTHGSLAEISLDLIREGWAGVVGTMGVLIPLLYAFQEGGWSTLLLFCGALLAFRYAVNLYLEQKRIHLDSLSQMLSILERKMGVSEQHAARVAHLARTLAETLKLPADQADEIFAAGILHDIGEAEVDPGVVSVKARNGILTLADLQAYQRHSIIGEGLVQQMQGMTTVATYIRHHHEHWDGSGYPDGLAGHAIPLGARILAAAEAVEACGSDLNLRIAAIDDLCSTVLDPGLADALRLAVRKVSKQSARIETAVEAETAARLQGSLVQAVRGSQLLEALGAGLIFRYETGTFRNFAGVLVEPPSATEVRRLVAKCLAAQQPVRDQILVGESVHDAYCLPTGTDSASLVLFDVTRALSVEREQTRRIFRAYRDVLSVATHGRLLMMEQEELQALTVGSDSLGIVDLASAADGRRCRDWVRSLALDLGWSQPEVFRLTVCVSEAVTNVLKHAGSGKVEIRRHGETLQVVVSDHGRGIPFDILPHATLMAGYSTQRSMGKGFSVMLRFVDQIRLFTSSEGTVLVLEKTPRATAMAGTGAD